MLEVCKFVWWCKRLSVCVSISILDLVPHSAFNHLAPSSRLNNDDSFEIPDRTYRTGTVVHVWDVYLYPNNDDSDDFPNCVGSSPV